MTPPDQILEELRNKTNSEHQQRVVNTIDLFELTTSEIYKVRAMLRDESEAFATDDTDIGNVDHSKMKRRLKDYIPCQATYNSLLRPLYQELKHYVEDLLNKQWITNSHSEYSSPVVAVRKKDGTLGLCCNCRKLNAKTIPDCHPPPRIQNIIDSLNKNQCFSLLDQTKAYHQLHMWPESKKIAAFLTQGDFMNQCLYHLNAPACFLRFMESCPGECRDDFAIPYLDTLPVYSGSFEDHLMHVRLVLQRLKTMVLRLRLLNVNYLKRKFLILDV